MKTLALLLLLSVAACAQTLRWSQPLPEPTFPADAGAFFTACQGDAAGNVVALVQYNKTDGPNQPFAGTKLFWFNSLGKPIRTEEFLAEDVSEIRVVNVSATILVLAIIEADSDLRIRKYTKRLSGVTFVDTAFPAHELYPLPPQTDRVGFFLCEKVNGRPAFLKRYVR